jgi:hypothetical protein
MNKYSIIFGEDTLIYFKKIAEKNKKNSKTKKLIALSIN